MKSRSVLVAGCLDGRGVSVAGLLLSSSFPIFALLMDILPYSEKETEHGKEHGNPGSMTGNPLRQAAFGVLFSDFLL